MTPIDPTPDRQSGSSRRAFLGSAATLGALALAGCAGDGPADAATPMNTSTEETTSTSTSTPTSSPSPEPAPDVPILNYALTLEHLENAFYRDGLEEFADDEIMAADTLSAFSETVRMQVPEYLAAIGAHEKAHVDALSATVRELGGTPVAEADYDFGYETPSEFLGVATALENTGVAAYAGAAPKVVSNDVLGAAAGIHSVEARHAAFLNLVNSSSPFPAAVDEAKTIEEVLEIAGQFVTSDVAAPELAEDRPTPARKADDGTGDVAILNYALTLEHIEYAFYRDGLSAMDDESLASADVLAEYSAELQDAVPARLRTVRDHEKAHVDAISATVEELGGTPVEEATYEFGYETPSEFLGVAKALENTGVAAYKGAAPSVCDDAVFAAALGIHSVEARHASFLNELNVESPFPTAVDEPETMAEVTEIAGQFIAE
jgi:rubrerythrin